MKKALNKEGLTLYRLFAPTGPHLVVPPCPVRQVGVDVSPTLDVVCILDGFDENVLQFLTT